MNREKPFSAEMNVQMTSHSILLSGTKSGTESNGRFLSFDVRDDVVVWNTEMHSFCASICEYGCRRMILL